MKDQDVNRLIRLLVVVWIVVCCVLIGLSLLADCMFFLIDFLDH
jgi:hypothetical protein